MAYLISEENLDRLLDCLKRAHGRAVGTPFWNLVKSDPLVGELLEATAAVEAETKNKPAERDMLK